MLAVCLAFPVRSAAKRFSKEKRRIVSIVVKKGDTLWRLAKHHHCSIVRIKRLNRMRTATIYEGQQLRVPARKPRALVRAFDPIKGQSIGGPRSGHLRHAVRLPRDPAYYLRRPYRAWGASHTVFYIRQAIAAVRRKFPKIHKLAIGDLSARRGGRLSNHRSHQSGRDVDLGLYFKKKPEHYPQSFVKAHPSTIHFPANWRLLRALISTSNKPGGVQRIYMDYNVQRMFYSWARKRGVSPRVLSHMFQYPHGRYSQHGIIHHWPHHEEHIHVRFKCPVGDDSCYL